MATTTPNYGLGKPLISEKYDVNVLNGNADKVDTELKKVSDRVEEIITTPAEGISAQEVIDARQGEVSLGANINGLKSQLADNTNKTSIFGRGAIHVESYFNLKIDLGDGSYDYAPCLQAAHNAAEAKNAVVVYPSAMTLRVGTPIRLKNQNGNYVFGNRCILKRIGLLATSDSPIMYYTSLTDVGGAVKFYNYNSGVYLFDFKFMGEGFGVGYKHAISGEAYFNNCIFDKTLEVGVLLSGTNGVHFNNCQIAGSKKGIFCARVAEDSYTSGYTSEGFGWNDGIYINGGMVTCPVNGYGVYYSGSTSEGVIVFRNVKWLGANGATGVYARSFTNFVVDGGWSEYFELGRVFFSDADALAANYEPDTMVVKNFQFTNRAGTYLSTSNYSIYSRAIRTTIEDCVFNNDPYQQHVYYSCGSSNILKIALSQQPTVIDTTYGTITFDKTNIIDKRDLTITDGTNNYYLQFNADMGANGYKYNTYTYAIPSKVKPKEWKYGTYVDEYTITRITNPVLSMGTTYTIKSTDDSAGYCEINRPIFQGVTAKSKMVGYGGFGTIIVKNPTMR